MQAKNGNEKKLNDIKKQLIKVSGVKSEIDHIENII